MAGIRIGLIGYGGWTLAAFIPALQLEPRAEIVSCAAPSEKSRQQIVTDLGNEISVFDEQFDGECRT